ncbi:hypothetical protein NUTIK01_33580 [Novosphingobium sp. IK01]|uniref:Uncharacterized protein n=1 Tax=Novosphingobium pituita TaxID=3056842 RepID=A0ABQ6PCH2_9SPHN|nr:hypothetical protein NUTIK01_33580 [Novosphingobium sp. IK01]
MDGPPPLDTGGDRFIEGPSHALEAKGFEMGDDLMPLHGGSVANSDAVAKVGPLDW